MADKGSWRRLIRCPVCCRATRHSITGTNCVYLERSPMLILTPSNTNCRLPIMRPTLVCLLLTALCNIAVAAPVEESTGTPVDEVSPDTVGPQVVSYYQVCRTRLCVDQSPQSCVVSIKSASGEGFTELLLQQSTADCHSPVYSRDVSGQVSSAGRLHTQVDSAIERRRASAQGFWVDFVSTHTQLIPVEYTLQAFTSQLTSPSPVPI